MKLLCFLLSIFIVNVWSNGKMKLKREIIIADKLIQQAINMNDFFVEDKFIANGLEHVIKAVVFKDKYSLGYLNHMFVTPECLYHNNIEESETIQRTLQNEIKEELKIAAPEVLPKDLNDLGFKNLGENRRNLTGKALRKIIIHIISLESKVSVPPNLVVDFSNLSTNDPTGHNNSDLSAAPTKEKSELNDDGDDGYCIVERCEAQDDEKSALPSIGQSEKIELIENYVGHDSVQQSSEAIIEHCDDLDDEKSAQPSIERLEIIENYIGKDVVQQSSESNRSIHEVPLEMMCELIALLSCTKFPTLNLFAFADENLKTCTIENSKSVPDKITYRQIDGIWCQELKKLLTQE
ncbi:uncharacterized protein LOC126835136 isoform X2 [Adelges cooleyi]|uniref:uncharacterized protein LOC126835136 isoform X2 n=1 Tax=Adelges cooleyi TaxID=133065 RepID=UPI00217F9252|nr:uncharacterized protein LOC126835136 isoform X2 [Adelges cooleyi]